MEQPCPKLRPMRLAQGGIVLMVAVSLLISARSSASSAAPSTPPGANGVIAFVSDGRAAELRGPGIAVIRADGRGARLLTHDKHDLSPAWSPAGTRLVFTRRGDLFVIRADGTHLHRLTSGAVMDYDPAWSPDGRQIAFIRENVLVAMRTDGRNMRTLYSEANEVLDGPTWSPDGKWIAFGSDNATIGTILVVARADGEPWAPASGREDDEYPDWSPGGGWIAFTRNVDDEDEVWIARTDGTGFTRMVTDDGADPSWAPNGRRIVVSSVSRGLVILDLSGTGRVLVPIGASQPAWQAVSP
jgi:TolB protein